MRKPTMVLKTLCAGSMRAGLKAAADAAPMPLLFACVCCGRAFEPITSHTAQVPRHRPKVIRHRRQWFRPSAWHTLARVGVAGDEIAADGLALAVPNLPAWIAVGDLILDRVPGDFPDEVVFTASIDGGFTFWIKSPNLLAGPWDWIVEQGRTPTHLGGPFATREAATADLLAVAKVEGIPTGAAALSDDVISVAAATGESRGDTPLHGPAARDHTVTTCSGDAARAVGHGPATDPEILALALDLAIVALRRARAHLPARIAA